MLFSVDDDARLWELEDRGDGSYQGRRAGDTEWRGLAMPDPNTLSKNPDDAYFEKCIKLAKRVKELTAVIEKQEGARSVIDIPNTD